MKSKICCFKVLQINRINHKKKRVHYADEANYWIDGGQVQDVPKETTTVADQDQRLFHPHDIEAATKEMLLVNNSVDSKKYNEDVFCDICCFKDRCVHVTPPKTVADSNNQV